MPAPPVPLQWASQLIGFFSFAVTLLTLLGVYRDLISTLRHASAHIPIELGNLREEIEAERWALRQRCREADSFGVFRLPSASGRGRRRERSRRRTNEVVHLLMRTVEKLWLDFRELERPFLIKSGGRAEAVRRGDYWGESDVDYDEKVGDGNLERAQELKRRKEGKRRNAMGMEEANVGLQGTFYRTDLAHRFVWWQSKGAVQRLADQVQRVQIRRIERDVYECDELIKRVLNKMDGGRDDDASGSGSDSQDRGPRSGGGLSRRGSRKNVSGGRKTVYESHETEAVRIPARSRPVSVRGVPRARSMSRLRSISPPRRRSPRLQGRNEESTTSPVEQRPSNTARRRAARNSRIRAGYEHEIARSGHDATNQSDVDGPRSRPGMRETQGQSYHRERPSTSDQRRSRDSKYLNQDRSRASYDSV